MVKTVVVLGGAYAGLHVAHYLLKNTDVKVILVTKNSHFYWNIASVRAIIPGGFKDEQIFAPVDKALSRYPKDRTELIIGGAEKVDTAAKTVALSTGQTLTYDILVLATGARTSTDAVPWKASGTYEEATTLLHKLQERVKAAAHVVVGGGGATGVETAAELGFSYGKEKEIVLLAGGAEILDGDSIAGAAAGELKKLNVNIRTGAKVASTNALPDGKTEVVLEGGEKIVTDLYLPSYGLTPNTEYLDAKFLNEKKYVVVDEFHKVKGAEDVWAAGDVISLPRAGFMITKQQAGGVGKNIKAVLEGKQPTAIKPPMDIFVVATGRSRGAGRAGSIKMLSFMVWMAKGRTLATQYLPGYIDGSVA